MGRAPRGPSRHLSALRTHASGISARSASLPHILPPFSYKPRLYTQMRFIFVFRVQISKIRAKYMDSLEVCTKNRRLRQLDIYKRDLYNLTATYRYVLVGLLSETQAYERGKGVFLRALCKKAPPSGRSLFVARRGIEPLFKV